MWISRKNYNKLIDKYEKRIDDLLNRLMSRNLSEYEVAKKVKIPSTDEELGALSRTDEIEYEIEQKRFNDMNLLQKKAKELKQEIHK